MTILIWILIVLAVVVAAVGLFVLVRRRQRSGQVMASRHVGDSGDSS
jgi:cytochrome c-type biogenesis protein CcmH/NrfF